VPELPEVETVKRGLTAPLLGASLDHVTLFRPNLRYDFPKDFASRLNGRRVLSLERRAKYLLIALDSQDIWVTHLGMTGRFKVHGADEAHTKHAHMALHFSPKAGGGSGQLSYIDPRRFGFMLLLSPDELYQATWYASLGPEPLSEAFSGDYLYEALKTKTSSIKALLMAQGLVCGLGNIYVCEALFAAGLHPEASGKTIGREACHDLVVAIKAILSRAIEAGGSSISDFAATSGELGYFQHQFSVYDRKGCACIRSGCHGVIERRVHQGRSSFYCNGCQKI